MAVDWSMVRDHVLRYGVVGGGATDLVVFGLAWHLEYPVGVAALGVTMLAVGAFLALFRREEAAVTRRGLLAPTVDADPDLAGDGRLASRDRILVYYLAGVFAFAVATLLWRILRLEVG